MSSTFQALWLLDGTEQEIPKPKDRMSRKMYYSGRKKKYTLKNLYTTRHY
ncbi:transposase family protein [Candidatus Nitrosocosmicus sp. R]